MALIKCPECGKEVSSTAKICVHCGFDLQNAEQSVKLSPSEEVSSIAKKRLISKSSLKIILPIFGALAVALILVIMAFSHVNRNFFEKFYYGQTRENVISLLGKPHIWEGADKFKGIGKEHETYLDVKLLGETGILRVTYNDGLLDFASFSYSYPYDANDPSASPSNKDKDKASQYSEKVISAFTKKYGPPDYSSDTNCFWTLHDTVITIYANLDSSGVPVSIYWNGR